MVHSPGKVISKTGVAMQAPTGSTSYTPAGIFTASLGSRNGVPAQTYQFAIAHVGQLTGSYSAVMRQSCANLGMKPVCDHPSYCKTDTTAIYLGQDHHISYPTHRNHLAYFPSGWSGIKANWNGRCAYTANAYHSYAHCNGPDTNTHQWRTPGQGPTSFVCARVIFTASLGSRNGVPARTYQFAIAHVGQLTGSYSAVMRQSCANLGMKPVCDHPSYCKTDTTAIYLGQDHHISYPTHRNHLAYFPSGWSGIKANWNGRCAYTANAYHSYAHCNGPDTNTHQWRTPGQGPTSFVCARVSRSSWYTGWNNFLGSSQKTFKSTNHREQLGQVQHARLDLPTETNPRT